MIAVIAAGLWRSSSGRHVVPASNVTSGPRRSVSTTARHPSANASAPYATEGGSGPSGSSCPLCGSIADMRFTDECRTYSRSNPATISSATGDTETSGSSRASHDDARHRCVAPPVDEWKRNPPPSRDGSAIAVE